MNEPTTQIALHPRHERPLTEEEARRLEKTLRAMERDRKFWEFIRNPKESKWYVPFISVLSAITASLTTLILKWLGWL